MKISFHKHKIKTIPQETFNVVNMKICNTNTEAAISESKIKHQKVCYHSI